MLSVNYAECHKQAYYAECHCAECRYTECHYAECSGANLKQQQVIDGVGLIAVSAKCQCFNEHAICWCFVEKTQHTL